MTQLVTVLEATIWLKLLKMIQNLLTNQENCIVYSHLYKVQKLTHHAKIRVQVGHIGVQFFNHRFNSLSNRYINERRMRVKEIQKMSH